MLQAALGEPGGVHGGRRGRARADPRFRQPGDAADRAPAARERRLLRDLAVQRRPRRASAASAPRGIILSGGPASVHRGRQSPRAPQVVFEAGVPVLGICYGQQTMCAQLGGEVQASDHREFGRAFVDVTDDCALFHGVWAHGRARAGVDEPRRPRDAPAAGLPRGRRSARARRSPPSPTTRGASTACSSIPRSCTRRTARSCCATSPTACWACPGTWTHGRLPRRREIARIRAQVGAGRVICGLSGGVDSVGRRGADP